MTTSFGMNSLDALAFRTTSVWLRVHLISSSSSSPIVIPSSMWIASFALYAWLSLLVHAAGTTTDQRCIEACSDYSGSLNFCRDAFDFKRELLSGSKRVLVDHADKGGIVAQGKDVGSATEHLKCMCEGTRGDGNLGGPKMKDSITTCLGCGITPNVIRSNLDVSTGSDEG